MTVLDQLWTKFINFFLEFILWMCVLFYGKWYVLLSRTPEVLLTFTGHLTDFIRPYIQTQARNVLVTILLTHLRLVKGHMFGALFKSVVHKTLSQNKLYQERRIFLNKYIKFVFPSSEKEEKNILRHP